MRSADKAASLAARGAEIALGDVTDAAGIAKALEGARGAYFLVSPDNTSNDVIGRGRRIADAYVAAVRKHGVKHAVLLSSAGAQEPSGTGPIVTSHNAEQAFSSLAGTALTIIRAAWFMENLFGRRA